MSKSFQAVIDAALFKGLAVKEFGDHSQIQCPAHNDGNPSLTVRPIEGSVLLYCHAGCDTRDVVEALGLTLGDLFDDEKGFTYEYPGGRKVVRTPDKRFYQDGNKADKSLFRADRPLGDVVYVTEGEKCVLAVESIGGQAVSPPNGAGAKPTKYDWEPLRGKTVRIIADRDEPGRKHAQAVADHLVNIAASTTIFEPTAGKDAADHIAAGGTLDGFKPIISADVLTLSEGLDKWREWRDSEGVEPIPLPWPSLSKKLAGGLYPGRVYIVAARAGCGKSTIGQNIVTHAALHHRTSFVVSVEMPVVEVVSRVIAAQAGVDYSNITRREFDEDLSRVDDFIRRYRNLPMFICDEPTLAVEQVAQRCRALKNSSGLELLFLDYVQLLSPSDRKAPRQEQVAHIARQVKLLAMELEIAVVMAAQLNRAAESEPPRLAHLRESGELEQSADCVLLVHGVENSPNVDISIAKNRTGPPGSVTLLRRFDQSRVDNA
jgi:hypothetical protein